MAGGETLVLIRDVTELNKRERALVTKDATIREIHHRVKNNLQTVAALLRMQARRIDSAEGKAALTEAVSRVSAIAVVHETLSQAFDEVVEFDGVADRVLQMVSSVAGFSRSRARREGTFGLVAAENATSLSLVMTELCQNAFEHGLAGHPEGTVRVRPLAEPGRLRVDVVDDGAGLAEGFSLEKSPSLGAVDREDADGRSGRHLRVDEQSGRARCPGTDPDADAGSARSLAGPRVLPVPPQG